MNISEKDIEEIADWLDFGMLCFFHRPSGVVEWHPDPEDAFFDEDEWEDLIQKIEDDIDNYIPFEKMNSRESFQVMEKFANSLSDVHFKDKLLYQLSNRKPFQNLKHTVDESEYRQDWFDFKKKAYVEFVRVQVG